MRFIFGTFLLILIASFSWAEDYYGNCPKSAEDGEITDLVACDNEIALNESKRMEQNYAAILALSANNKKLASLVKSTQDNWLKYVRSECTMQITAIKMEGESLSCKNEESIRRNIQLESDISCLKSDNPGGCW